MDYHPRPPVVTVGALDAVLAAYRQILDTPDVTADDDFFELGGDSIQAMNIIALVQEMIGAEISVGMFFTYPTPPSWPRPSRRWPRVHDAVGKPTDLDPRRFARHEMDLLAAGRSAGTWVSGGGRRSSGVSGIGQGGRQPQRAGSR